MKLFVGIVLIIILSSIIPLLIATHHNWVFFDNFECGGSFAKKRIIGGYEGTLKQFPWMARVGQPSHLIVHKIEFLCGASLINYNYVITAAHCIFNRPVLIVRLGHGTPHQQDFKAKTVDIHEGFSPNAKQHDIALIRLHKSAYFNSYVRPVCLPKRHLISEPVTYRHAIVAGWGFSSNRRSKDSFGILYYVDIPIIPLKYCNRAYRKYMKVDDKCHICAGGNPNKDSCIGDSGSPLMAKLRPNSTVASKFHLVGVVSTGYKFCGAEVPAVYAKIGFYLEWILDHVQA